LVTITALGASASAGAQSTPAASSIFTAAQQASLKTLVDAIIPRTDTPGASDAGVPAFIERRAAANKALADRIRKGLETLEAESKRQFNVAFSELDEARQVALLTPASRDASTPLGAFFKLAKGLTVDGYYTSKPGLTQELGWHGNTFLPEFKGCTHPEHQA
jgi:hypothetical protein